MSLLLVFILQTIASFIDRLLLPQYMGGGKKVKKTKVRLAHELPKRRKIAIQEALAAHQTEDRPEWDRSANWGNIKLFRKTIKPGSIRTISLPLLEVDLGDPWPIPVTVLHGVRRTNNYDIRRHTW